MYVGYTQRCYVCKKGKKNSDCSTIETCKKDEDVSLVTNLVRYQSPFGGNL